MTFERYGRTQFDMWPEERTEKLIALWADPKMSASAIAKEIGEGLTRNSVIGKAHRLGLHRRVPTPPGEGEALIDKPPRKAPTHIAGKRMLPRAFVIEPSPPGKRIGVVDLTSTTCRWPIGDVGAPDFTFCGALAPLDKPYCEYHARKGVEPRRPPQWTRNIS